jgi:hypothetical protein
MEDYQKENKEFLEQFSSSITKTVNVMQFETKRNLEGYRDDLNRNITNFFENNKDIENKLQRYIGNPQKYYIIDR